MKVTEFDLDGAYLLGVYSNTRVIGLVDGTILVLHESPRMDLFPAKIITSKDVGATKIPTLCGGEKLVIAFRETDPNTNKTRYVSGELVEFYCSDGLIRQYMGYSVATKIWYRLNVADTEAERMTEE